jgi:hypothetical protein
VLSLDFLIIHILDYSSTLGCSLVLGLPRCGPFRRYLFVYGIAVAGANLLLVIFLMDYFHSFAVSSDSDLAPLSI